MRYVPLWLREASQPIPNAKPKPASFQSVNEYIRLHSHIEAVLGAKFKSQEFFSQEQFEQSNYRISKKFFKVSTYHGLGGIFCICSVTALVFAWNSNLTYLFGVASVLLLTSGAFLTISRSEKSKIVGLHFDDLCESDDADSVKQIVIELQKSAVPLFVRDSNGDFFELSKRVWYADNWLGFVLATRKNRPCLTSAPMSQI